MVFIFLKQEMEFVTKFTWNVLRSQERLKDMPAVALTSLADEEHRTQALQAGFDRYLVKLDRRELLETLQELRLESAREVQDGGEA